MLSAKINGHQSLEIDVTSSSIAINGKTVPVDIAPLGPDRFHIIRDNKSYNAEILDVNKQTKTVTIRINGATHSVQLKDKFDLLLEKLGMTNGSSGRLNNIKAPMPGLIIDLRVGAGQTIQQGDSLLILEAMKMENIIKASGEGTVKRVLVKKGDSVEKGQVLIEF
ncbi:biotin/lipoyl-containing protein [Chryseolinea sp. T2]|uniref:biotin/lipoyl-containing protein n=1 Tax=Chryseolinea sp. T2 TaxID=3129255 RepID=UPI003077C119